MKKKSTVILDPEVDDWCYLLAQVVTHLREGQDKQGKEDDHHNGDSDEDDPEGPPPRHPSK